MYKFLQTDLKVVKESFLDDHVVRFFRQFCESSKRSIQTRKFDSHIKIQENGLVTVGNTPVKAEDFTPSTPLLAKNAWFVHFSQLILSMNSLLSALKKVGIDFDELKLINGHFHSIFDWYQSDESESLSALGTVLELGFSTIREMLQDASQTCLSIPISALLSFLGRCFSIKIQAVYSKKPELSLLLKLIQLNSLKTINILISVLGDNLASHSYFIHQILIEAINGSVLVESESFRSDKERLKNIFTFKAHVYETIATWFKAVGPNMFVSENFANILLKHIFSDIKPELESIELRNVKALSENNLAHDMTTENPKYETLKHFNFQCISAASSFLKNSSIFLSEDQMHRTAVFFIDEAFLYHGAAFNDPRFFSHPSTRHELLSLLTFLTQHQECIPLVVAVNIFSRALEFEKDVNVKNYCYDQLNVLNSMINPKKYVLPVISKSRECTQGTTDSFKTDRQSEKIQNIDPQETEKSTPQQLESLPENGLSDTNDCIASISTQIFVSNQSSPTKKAKTIIETVPPSCKDETSPNRESLDIELEDLPVNYFILGDDSSSDSNIHNTGLADESSQVNLLEVTVGEIKDVEPCEEEGSLERSIQNLNSSTAVDSDDEDMSHEVEIQQIFDEEEAVCVGVYKNSKSDECNVIQLDDAEEEEIFAIELPKSVIMQSSQAKRPRLDIDLVQDESNGIQ